MTYQPPFTISSHAVSVFAEISALVERYVIRLEQRDALKLRCANRIKTIHSSLAIEGNTLSLKHVTEITSPGGLPRGQTAARALAGYSKIRNDVLAKALNYMRFIEEWGSGLRRVNKVFANYGLRDISLEDAGFAVKMNVYRATKAGDKVVNPDLSSKKRKDDTVKPDGVTINDRLIESVRKNPGQNADFHARQLGRTRRTVMRYLSKLSGLVEFRGAPKTGGYYCKDEHHT